MRQRDYREEGTTKKIWIDLDNSPHVPFFKPIARELEKKGYSVPFTARDCFQVCGLADYHGLSYRKVGRHYGKNKAMKILGTLYRALQLTPNIARIRPDLFVSHGSRAGAIVSAFLGIPIVMIADYEFSYALPFVHLKMIIIPEIIPAEKYAKMAERVAKYPGIKEDVYVPDFRPNVSVLGELGLSTKEILVTIRPPATEAHYHNPESEKLFAAVIEHLAERPELRMVILPRNEVKQTAWIKERWSRLMDSRKIIIPDHVVDGLDLMWFSDLVISGGGTMNREAAALGVPVYSIFRGTIGAVDQYLSKEGRLTLLASPEDVRAKVKVVRRDKTGLPGGGEKNALKVIVDAIIKCVEE